MKEWLKTNYSRLITIRHYLHQHPELGYTEHHTSNYLKNILQQAGYKIFAADLMGTGFFTEFGNQAGPVLGIRAELDALPIQDIKTVDYRSRNDGVMHACGHDVHMAIVSGVALWLMETKLKINGRIRFIFQPAEEQAPGGALRMMEAGVTKDLDHLLGLHVLPTLPYEKIGVRTGTMSARVQLLELKLSGPGGHTSRPGETVNLISATASLIKGLEKIAEQLSSPESPVVLSFGQIGGGDTFNVIPSQITLKGTLRYINPDIENSLNQKIREAVEDVSRKTEAYVELKVPYTVPMIKNDKQFIGLVRTSAVEVLGEHNVVHLERSSMGSDDFGFYSREVPSAFFRIGSAIHNVRDLHVPDFDVDERCIQTSLLVLSSVIERYFS